MVTIMQLYNGGISWWRDVAFQLEFYTSVQELIRI